jgi:imidazolonepropionase-like amidohydrolase
MWADLVLLDANPLENINNTKQINTVIKQGKAFNRAQLDTLLKNKP